MDIDRSPVVAQDSRGSSHHTRTMPRETRITRFLKSSYFDLLVCIALAILLTLVLNAGIL